ncbi:b5857f28-2868-4ff3-8a75-9f39b162a3a3-CDS [Sclerotinia trifoliorum]|uniref:B5857f28-2868-4ff3-8a75-9f39b162a3a3-CDS n=1 Tax=Sclerotinia trifoliorum TaxID=28548 RepID=A0A8H2VUL3_9HELO|nr:b5857f28-2868-4ff3-8a75-9f39b162a3a3-CDS [Sclerotinia trifoliorum]
MENSLLAQHLYNTSYQATNSDTEIESLYDGLYGAESELTSSSSSFYDAASSKESLIPLSENHSPTSSSPYPSLHCPARLDWHDIDQPLSKNFANDLWLKTRRPIAASDSDEDTESFKKQKDTHRDTSSKLEADYNKIFEYLTPTSSPKPLDTLEQSSPTTTAISCTEISPSGTIENLTVTPTMSPLNLYRGIVTQTQSQAQYAYIVLHDAIPVAAESLAITTVTGVYITLEEANSFVERVAEETCRDVPEEHLTLLIDDGAYGFDILDMERHVLHRVYIEKQAIRGDWSEPTEIEEMGVLRGQEGEAEIFDGLANLSL